MMLDMFLEAILSSASLPERLSRILIAVAMLVAGLAFLALSVLMGIRAVSHMTLGALFLAGAFLVLSPGSFWLMYRAARGCFGSRPEEA